MSEFVGSRSCAARTTWRRASIAAGGFGAIVVIRTFSTAVRLRDFRNLLPTILFIGGIAGLILGAASMKKPVLIDGLISTAGALIASCLEPRSIEYMIAAHRSVEQGHRIALQRLRKEPLLDLNLRLGEGTGGALAMYLVEAAVRVLTEVASFEEADVSREDK